MIGAMPGGTRRLRLTYIGPGTADGSTATLDFGNFVIPRRGVVGVGFVGPGGPNTSISSMTIGGDAASLPLNTGGGQKIGFGTLYRQAGTYNVTVTLGATNNNSPHMLFVFLIEHAKAFAPFATVNGAGGSNVEDRTISIDTPRDGAVIYLGGMNAQFDMSFSSADLVDQIDFNAAFTRRAVCGISYRAVAEAGHTETVSWSGMANGRLGGIAFR